VTRVVIYEISWPLDWLESDWFSAGFFAFNEWYPDFFAYAVNGLFLVFGFRIMLSLIRLIGRRWAHALALSLPLLLWLLILNLLEIVIAHSNIPLSFEHLFDLRLSSYFFFSLLGFFLYSFQKTVFIALQLNKNEHLKVKLPHSAFELNEVDVMDKRVEMKQTQENEYKKQKKQIEIAYASGALSKESMQNALEQIEIPIIHKQILHGKAIHKREYKSS
jgi:hypothetical protein